MVSILINKLADMHYHSRKRELVLYGTVLKIKHRIEDLYMVSGKVSFIS